MSVCIFSVFPLLFFIFYFFQTSANPTAAPGASSKRTFSPLSAPSSKKSRGTGVFAPNHSSGAFDCRPFQLASSQAATAIRDLSVAPPEVYLRCPIQTSTERRDLTEFERSLQSISICEVVVVYSALIAYTRRKLLTTLQKAIVDSFYSHIQVVFDRDDVKAVTPLILRLRLTLREAIKRGSVVAIPTLTLLRRIITDAREFLN
jgi:hypothetical protein